MTGLVFSDPALLSELEKYSRPRTVPQNTILISPGDNIVFLPIVTRGVLRIVRQSDDGREVFLYHLYPGQTCAMAISCCQSSKKSMVKAIAEDETEVLQIPVKLVEEWFRYPEWKAYISQSYSERFSELIEVIDLISFSNLDTQLLHYLQARAKAHNTSALLITHQQIADELHTHREVVSRLLRTMEHKKLVKLSRNVVELL